MQLTGARALITGAGGGIGRAIAADLVKQGVQVLLVDRDARALGAVGAHLASARTQFAQHVAESHGRRRA